MVANHESLFSIVAIETTRSVGSINSERLNDKTDETTCLKKTKHEHESQMERVSSSRDV